MGHGETTFVQMLKALLEKEGHPCIYFNAWESDFADDPLVAFMGAIEADLSAEPAGESPPNARKRWESTKTAARVIVQHGAPIALRLATQGLVTPEMLAGLGGVADEVSKGAGDLARKLVEDRIKADEQQRVALKNFRKQLEEFAATLASARDRKAPVVFFVDELDRCRPLYAIELLERMNHLFSVSGLMFILAIDRQQLGHSLRAQYGSGMDAQEYLRRFIDVDYRLPAPRSSTFPELVFDRLGF